MPMAVYLAMAFVVGFAFGFALACILLGYRMVSSLTHIPHAEKADKKIERLRKKAWRGRAFRVDSTAPDESGQQTPQGDR